MMRVIGIVLVLIGAITIGVQSFGQPFQVRPPGEARAEEVRDEADKSGWVPRVVGGIAVVSGLLLLTTNIRRD